MYMFLKLDTCKFTKIIFSHTAGAYTQLNTYNNSYIVLNTNTFTQWYYFYSIYKLAKLKGYTYKILQDEMNLLIFYEAHISAK